MTLHAPFEISARLLPAVRVGTDSWISIQFDGESGGRTRYRYFIDAPGFKMTANCRCYSLSCQKPPTF